MPKRSKQDKKGLFNRALIKTLAAAFVIGCIVTIYATERDRAAKERELASIQSKINTYELENADLQRILDSDDMSDYIEKIAVEERGYAYPDERRFYDTSRD